MPAMQRSSNDSSSPLTVERGEGDLAPPALEESFPEALVDVRARADAGNPGGIEDLRGLAESLGSMVIDMVVRKTHDGEVGFLQVGDVLERDPERN
jgi:hypothetical protein